MSLMNGEQYKESLRKLKPTVYYLGEKIDNLVDHCGFKPHVNGAAMTYEMAFMPEFENLMVTKSHIDGEKINRFTHIHHSQEELVTKIRMLRAIGQQTGTCFQRCVGHDGLNSVFSVTYDIDKEKGTQYHKRFLDFLKYVQKTDIMVSGSMTDPKGDRSLSPSQQKDPDQYVHVVEKKKDGIVVRGAKAHITGGANSHGHLVMPTRNMDKADADYAVCFYVPVDAPGVTHIFGRQTNDIRKCNCRVDQGNAEYGIVGGEALIIFDDVFVPWEHVFMCGEYEFAFDLVERFATQHRQNYGGCKVGVADVLIGTTYALCESQGTGKAAHVRDKLVEMSYLNENLYCCSIACSAQGVKMPAGSFIAYPLLANITKLTATRCLYEIARLSHDLGGGLMATMPSEMDLYHPEIGKYVEKYVKGVAEVPSETRYRLVRLLEAMTCGTALVESMHGAGSPQAHRIMIQRRTNWELKKKLAERLAKINHAT